MNYLLTHPAEVLHLAGQHMLLVVVATVVAALIGLPLGVLITRRPRLSRWVLGVANVLQTIPSLALFGFLIPLPFFGGIGASTAIIALIAYALLPIIRNTHAGITSVDPGVREAGRGMGMTDWQLLTQVEVPLALGVIFTGLRLATVIGVGVATIAAAIGAGGLGTYIFRGVSMVDNQLILAGAIPAAALALLADFALGLVSRYVTRDPLRRMRVVGVGVVLLGLIAGGALLAVSRDERGARPIVIGSKNFTEQTILGELLAQRLERAGFRVDRRFYLAGTLICHEALTVGEIDMYVEYSGTAYTAILNRKPISDGEQVLRELREAYLRDHGVRLMRPLGFNNTFAIMIRGGEARRLNLKTLSEAAPHSAQWRAAFGNEFIERADGLKGLSETYGFRFAQPPTVMDLGLTYRALADGQADMIAGDATNGLIAALDLAVLADDKHYFPPYHAVPFVREETLRANPGLAEALDSLGDTLSDDAMRKLNYAVDGEQKDVRAVVSEFLGRLPKADK